MSLSQRSSSTPARIFSVSQHAFSLPSGQLSPSRPPDCRFHNKHSLGHVLLTTRCIDCPGELRPQSCSTSLTDKTGIRCNIFPANFVNQVCYFYNLNKRRYQCDRRRPRQRVWRTGDILQLLFVRGAQWCALSSTEVQFHRSVKFLNWFHSCPDLTACTVSTVLPLPPTFRLDTPSMAYIIPGLEAFAPLNLTHTETGKAAAYVQSTLSNGWSTHQPAASSGTAAFALVALASSFIHSFLIVQHLLPSSASGTSSSCSNTLQRPACRTSTTPLFIQQFQVILHGSLVYSLTLLCSNARLSAFDT